MRVTRATAMHLTRHARDRMQQMGVTYEDVVRTMCEAEVDYSQPRYGNGSRMAQRDGLAIAYCVVESGEVVIKSVLRREVDQWER